jgi:hypothetical protein
MFAALRSADETAGGQLHNQRAIGAILGLWPFDQALIPMTIVCHKTTKGQDNEGGPKLPRGAFNLGHIENSF